MMMKISQKITWTLKNATDAAPDDTAANINDDDTSIKWHNNWIFTLEIQRWDDDDELHTLRDQQTHISTETNIYDCAL